MRKDSPLLKAELDRFVRTHRRGTIVGNVLFSEIPEEHEVREGCDVGRGTGKVPDHARAVQEIYGDQYGMDWLLMAAQGYQESGLEPEREAARSARSA